MFLLLATLFITVVVANVFIRTGTELEKDTYQKLRAAEANSANGITVLAVSAENGENGSVNKFTMTIRTSPGAGAIPLDALLVAVRNHNETHIYKYAGQNMTTFAEANNTHYTLEYIHTSTPHQNGKLLNAEVADLKFITPYAVEGDTELFVRFMPKTGTPTMKMIYVPEIVNQKRIQIYPQT